MAYTPELSDRGSATLRRLAWFLEKPMTQTMEVLLESIAGKAAQLKPEAVCDACRDKSKCDMCGFNPDQNGKGKEVKQGP